MDTPARSFALQLTVALGEHSVVVEIEFPEGDVVARPLLPADHAVAVAVLWTMSFRFARPFLFRLLLLLRHVPFGPLVLLLLSRRGLLF